MVRSNLRERIPLKLLLTFGLMAALLCLYSFPVEEALPPPSKDSRGVLTLESERFGALRLFKPELETERVVALFSDSVGWRETESEIANQIRQEGGFVIGIDTKSYLSNLKADEEECDYIAGEIERLLQSSQKGAGLKRFHPGVLGGVGLGGGVAEIAFLQHPEDFIGVVKLQSREELPFTPCVEGSLALDENRRLSIDPDLLSRVRQGAEMTALLSAVELAGAEVKSTKLESALPLIVNETSQKKSRDIVIFYSGDGGWAAIDKEISRRLVEQGIPVVGVDSLQYFWSKREQSEASEDLGRIIRDFIDKFNAERVTLVGFSFGADVLPFFFNGLTDDEKLKVYRLVLLSPSLTTDFEVHIEGWLGFDEIDGGRDIPAELSKLSVKTLCLFGKEESGETACEKVAHANIISESFPGDHHFDGEYDKLSERITKLIREEP